jgi:TonB family protein
MTIRFGVLLIAVILGSFAFAENKGFCPSHPSVSVPTKATSLPSDTDNASSVSVTVLTVVSDTGYVCSTQVLQGIEKEVDAQAVSVIRKQHFAPAKHDGHAVPVLITVTVNFTRDKDGKLTLTSSAPTPSKPSVITKP